MYGPKDCDYSNQANGNGNTGLWDESTGLFDLLSLNHFSRRHKEVPSCISFPSHAAIFSQVAQV